MDKTNIDEPFTATNDDKSVEELLRSSLQYRTPLIRDNTRADQSITITRNNHNIQFPSSNPLQQMMPKKSIINRPVDPDCSVSSNSDTNLYPDHLMTTGQKAC